MGVAAARAAAVGTGELGVSVMVEERKGARKAREIDRI